MTAKEKIGYVFAGATLAIAAGLTTAIIYANKCINQKNNEKDKINAEEPENNKEETMN